MPDGIAGAIKKHFKEIDDNKYILEKTDRGEFNFDLYKIEKASENEDILIVRGLSTMSSKKT